MTRYHKDLSFLAECSSHIVIAVEYENASENILVNVLIMIVHDEGYAYPMYSMF